MAGGRHHLHRELSERFPLQDIQTCPPCGLRILQDLYKPEPGRLKRNLCAIINLAKFRDEKVDMLDDLEQSVAEKLRLEKELLAEQEKEVETGAVAQS